MENKQPTQEQTKEVEKYLMVRWSMEIGYIGEVPIISTSLNVPLQCYVEQRSMVIQQLEALLLASKPSRLEKDN